MPSRLSEVFVPHPGRLTVIPGGPELVVAAPHGDLDHFTGDMVREIVERIGCAGVVAEEFIDPVTSRRVNVNRPTEGAGVDPSEEVRTPLADHTYQRYLRSLGRASEGRMGDYVEVHGNETRPVIELALWNIPWELAGQIKEIYYGLLEEIPDDVRRVDLWVEGIDPIVRKAAANKEHGCLTKFERALHFELPTSVRIDPIARSVYTEILSELISEALAPS